MSVFYPFAQTHPLKRTQPRFACLDSRKTSRQGLVLRGRSERTSRQDGHRHLRRLVLPAVADRKVRHRVSANQQSYQVTTRRVKGDRGGEVEVNGREGGRHFDLAAVRPGIHRGIPPVCQEGAGVGRVRDGSVQEPRRRVTVFRRDRRVKLAWAGRRGVLVVQTGIKDGWHAEQAKAGHQGRDVAGVGQRVVVDGGQGVGAGAVGRNDLDPDVGHPAWPGMSPVHADARAIGHPHDQLRAAGIGEQRVTAGD